MKAIKKRSEWQNLLRVLRNNAGYLRVLNIREIHRKRIQREYTECMCSGYDPEFERWWRKEQRKPHRIKVGFNSYEYVSPDLY
ncbi:MAG: hypothetical protein K2H49_09850 [Muribaculaceae bacterium]|nr:hypothetical protein [Muribaculaceae bacterium]